MPPFPSSDRVGLERDVRSLRRLTAGIKRRSETLDVKCWEQIEQGLTSVLGYFPEIKAGTFQWTSSSAGEVALECMQAIVEHAPEAMKVAVESSRQGQLGCFGILHAVLRVLVRFKYTAHADTLTAAWPTGIQSSVLAMAKIAPLIPQTDLCDPSVNQAIILACDHLVTGRVDGLSLKLRVNLILLQVREDLGFHL